MTAPEPSLPEKVLAIDGALGRHRIGHAFGGALALAYYAEPRATIAIDVNVFLPPAKRERVASALRELGIDDSTEEQDGQVRWWWGRTPVDLFFAYDPFHDAMRDGIRRVPFGEQLIPILGPEHLIVCKAAFDRPKDWLDIEGMLVGEPVDRTEITTWMERIAGADDPKTARLAELLAR